MLRKEQQQRSLSSLIPDFPKVCPNGHSELTSGALAVRYLADVVLAFHPLLDRWAHEEEGSM